MKKLFIIGILFPCVLFSQTEKNPCETLLKLNALIQENHYKPKPVDDSLSVYVFTTFLSRLDEENRLFIEPEIKELSKHKYKIDDYIKANNCDFLHEFYLAYNKTITRYTTMLAAMEKEPFPLSSTESVVFSKKAFPYAKDEAEVKHLYKKRILFNTLRDVAELSTNKDSLVTNFNTIAATSKAKVFDKSKCKIESYQFTEAEFQAIFFSVFCSYFDPHTEYFSANEKASFFSTVSSDNLTFGLYVSMTEKDEMTVDDIIPGSSAYFTEKIDKGDQLIKIKYKDEEYEIACASMKKIDEIISSNEYKKADFTFRKKSGQVYSVSLVKKILKDYQNNVFSFKIKKDNATFGYIRIPSFYSTFENGKSNVSNDVTKEVYKLEEDNVDGIIIDLENDGGGSMEEAIRLSGLFIDYGPLAVMNNNKNKKEILKDTNRGTIYNGPMVVMINGFSASASEFFTNAMQDYNRAIIIGNKSLGKASMQRVFPLDENNDEFLKLTLEKFYRITGKSNQYIGITPDVEIPLLFDKQMPREDSNDTALKNDEIAVTLKYNRLPNETYANAIALSKKRIETSKEANDIIALNAKINPFYDNNLPPITLKFDAVFTDVTKVNALWKSIKSANEKEYPIAVTQNSVDDEYQKYDDYLKSCNTERIKDLKKNFHVLEAINILNDIKQSKP
ncbi:S41 family peptidase [Flavobacterium sp.]|uniref:S41 family peptidase n=1 Tax=Flavobacterium sp. TaxID=239 RepID=UPI002FDA9AFC